MSKAKEFWLALADQYEEWYYESPKDLCGNIELTCDILDSEKWGWDGDEMVFTYPCFDLRKIWQYWDEREHHTQDGLDFPCGEPWGGPSCREAYEEKQKDFCFWMADTIRAYVKSGAMPWE